MIPNVNFASLKAGEKLEPKELATKVQAMFMEVMLKAMEESVEAGPAERLLEEGGHYVENKIKL